MIKKILFIAFIAFNSLAMVAQTTVTGTVTDSKTGDLLPGANIKVSRKLVGTSTDFDGNFVLKVTDNPPFTLEISMLGFQTSKVEITKNNQKVAITLTENETSLDEIVVSASRTPERIMESPVTIERMDARAIKNTSSPSFYDGLENLKGVDINTSSLTFKSVNTRGFATFANTRFMQLVDGMDNSSPALNFALGNLLGMSELDVKTVELLPGASSALYGANAFNGIMFMTSKSPFEDQGISFSVKSGITAQESAGNNEFIDTNIRMAYAFSDKFAAKATLSYLKGTEWHATDYRNTVDGAITTGDRNSDPNYDGANILGDLASNTFNWDALAGTPAGTLGSSAVSRTGYRDIDLIGDEARSVKMGVSLNYRPLGDDRLEVIWNSKFGTGNTIYQGGQRYSIKNFFMAQHKLEVRGKNFFVRGYTTNENAGDSYNGVFAALNINRQWVQDLAGNTVSPAVADQTWFGNYATAYLGALAGLGVPGFDHSAARTFADRGRLVPGTPGFQTAFNKITSDPDLLTGAKFRDETKLYHGDANYNFQDLTDWAEIQVGASYRRYSLNSFGNIFTDADGPINYDEYGVYTQLQKSFLDEDRLKLTASARYDKAQNFDGNVSPRLSLAYAAGENKNHNFRASVQSGFRNPTTQDQYIGLDIGPAILVGSAADNLDRYSLVANVSPTGQFIANTFGSGIGATTTLTGNNAYSNTFSASSVQAFAAGQIAAPVATTTDLVSPEKVTAFEVGYRGLAKVGEQRITVDLSAYYNVYEDFISGKNVIAPYYGNTNFSDTAPVGPGGAAIPLAIIALGNDDFKVFQAYTNSSADISSYGASIGLNTKILNGFNLGLNYTYAKFDFDNTNDPDFEPGFNTPEHKVKLQFGKPNLTKNLGFNVNFRWQNEFLWQSSFIDGTIEARTVIDAQVNYKLPSLKSVIKLGGANLTGKEYLSAPGVGAVGSQYYLSWTINN
jgi:outer membrane receptor for ferrienterochelin and colicin